MWKKSYKRNPLEALGLKTLNPFSQDNTLRNNIEVRRLATSTASWSLGDNKKPKKSKEQISEEGKTYATKCIILFDR